MSCSSSTSPSSSSSSPSSCLSTSSSSSSSCRTKQSKWYLQVAVAGKPNPMFLSDNLTPAPRHILLQQLYGEQHPLVKSAEPQSQSSSPSCSSTASSIASSTSSTSTHLDSASSIDSDIETSPSSSCRRLLDEDETPRTQSSAAATCSPSTTTASVVGGIASQTQSPFSSPSPSQCQSRSPSHFHRAVSSVSDADADIPLSSASTCATLPSSSTASSTLSPPLGPSRCSIKLISGKPVQVSRFKAFINGNSSTSRPRQDDLMTVREDDDEDTSIVSMNSSPLVSTASSCASTDSRLPSPLSAACSYSSFLSSCNHLSVGATEGFGQDAWLVVCEQPALTLPNSSLSSSSTTRIPVAHQQSSSSSNSPPLPPSFLLGVADGVGGWRSSGVDSGVMSRHMMETAMEVLRQESLRKDKDAILFSMHYPKSLLERAYDKILEEGDVQAGSTTACFLSFVPAEHHSCPSANVITAAPLPPDQTKPQLLQAQPSSSPPPSNANSSSSSKLYLHTCNLGDSGFCVVRGQRVIFHSSPQRDVHHVHQLAVIPASLRAQHQDTDYEYADDKPDDALCACCELMENDVVILASDGLWDNIQPKDEIVSVPGIGLARLRYKQDAPERTLFQHQTMAQFVNECKLHSSDAAVAVSQHSTTATNGTDTSAQSLRDENTGDVDVEKCCEKLATYAVDYMGLQEGKPDDLTLLIAQVKLATSPEPPEHGDTALSMCSSFSCSSSSSTCSTLSTASSTSSLSASSTSFSSSMAAAITMSNKNSTEHDKTTNSSSMMGSSSICSVSSLSAPSVISVESKLT